MADQEDSLLDDELDKILRHHLSPLFADWATRPSVLMQLVQERDSDE